MGEMMLEIVRDLDLDIHDEWPFLEFVEVLLKWRRKKGNDENYGRGRALISLRLLLKWHGQDTEGKRGLK